MPYPAGKNLPGEYASKIGHLDVLKSPLVRQIIENFEQPDEVGNISASWQPYTSTGEPLDIIFAVDGSWQPISDERPPFKQVAFVKTALIRVDQIELNRINKHEPHPLALRDLMSKTAIYHATALPLRHIYFQGSSVYDAVRRIIFESFKDDSLKGEVMETFKWLAYEKWSESPRPLPAFECPHEINGKTHKTTLDIDAEEGECRICRKNIFITDMLGFHLEMSENAASESIPAAYMNIHETLLLFTGVRIYWEDEKRREVLRRCLFMKDGPLQIRAQYSKLVNPIRRFLQHAHSKGYDIHIVGQEKTGIFVDHLNLIAKDVSDDYLFIPDHKYICEQIQGRPSSGAAYGKDTNYGAKVFWKPNENSRFVLNIPVCVSMGKFIKNPNAKKLIGLNRILTTLKTLISARHENALFPIELANSIASLSTYPSVQVLQLFTEAAIKNR